MFNLASTTISRTFFQRSLPRYGQSFYREFGTSNNQTSQQETPSAQSPVDKRVQQVGNKFEGLNISANQIAALIALLLGGIWTELKSDIKEVRTEIGEVRTELKNDIKEVRTELKSDIEKVASNVDLLVKADIKRNASKWW